MDQLVRLPRQLGSVIQSTRVRQGMTQSELAGISGTQQKTISAIENGSVGVKLGTYEDRAARAWPFDRRCLLRLINIALASSSFRVPQQRPAPATTQPGDVKGSKRSVWHIESCAISEL